MNTFPMDPYVRNTTNPAKRKGLLGHRSGSKPESGAATRHARYHQCSTGFES